MGLTGTAVCVEGITSPRAMETEGGTGVLREGKRHREGEKCREGEIKTESKTANTSQKVLKILDFEPVIEDNGLLPCWLCCAKLTARERVKEREKWGAGVAKRGKKGGGVICEITVGCWRTQVGAGERRGKWKKRRKWSQMGKKVLLISCGEGWSLT